MHFNNWSAYHSIYPEFICNLVIAPWGSLSNIWSSGCRSPLDWSLLVSQIIFQDTTGLKKKRINNRRKECFAIIYIDNGHLIFAEYKHASTQEYEGGSWWSFHPKKTSPQFSALATGRTGYRLNNLVKWENFSSTTALGSTWSESGLFANN